MLTLTLAVFCHNFEHRFCWMLSSLLQQDPSDVELTVDAGYVRGTGNPTCKDVLDFFEAKGLRVKHTAYDKSEIDTYQKRGLVRNQQLATCNTDWIWFGDCDMVVPANFLVKFGKVISGLPPEDTGKMLTCARYSTLKPSDPTDALVAEHTYPCVVQDAYECVGVLPKKKKSNIGAGYCQIANVQNLRDNHGGFYVNPENSPDNKWQKFWKTRSDQRFRNMLGKKRVPLPPFIHLQHSRDNEVRHHIEVQR